MNIENAKIAIDKMAFFIPEDVLNDLYKDHTATAEVLVHDESRTVFSIVYHDKKDKRILSVTVKHNEVNVHYNGTMQVFSHRIDESFYNSILNVLFDVQDIQVVTNAQPKENNMTTQDFLKTINTLRLQNKGKWYVWQGIVNGKDISLKGYNTWLQILRVDGLQCGNCADRSVKDFKNDLASAVE